MTMSYCKYDELLLFLDLVYTYLINYPYFVLDVPITSWITFEAMATEPPVHLHIRNLIQPPPVT